MIVDSMTLQEIRKAVLCESDYVMRKGEYCLKDFRGFVLKSRQFPCAKTYTSRTPKNKTEFTLKFIAEKRSMHNNPSCNIFAKYYRPEGLYVAQVGESWKTIYIFPPHFLSRYRERILKDESLSIEDTISNLEKNLYSVEIEEIDDVSLEEFDKDENKDEKSNIVAFIPEGLIFGFREGDVYLFKTIVSPGMLHKDQIKQYEELFQMYLSYASSQLGDRAMYSIEALLKELN